MIVLVDVSCIGYRCFYSMISLSKKELKWGLVFGFLNELLKLASQFDTDEIYLCWDSQESIRKQQYPNYKANRRQNLSDEEKKRLDIYYKTINKLRKKYLPKIGWYQNSICRGMEGDDVIASLAEMFSFGEKVLKKKPQKITVVTSDQDMYQLLKIKNLQIYHPITKSIVTKQIFKDKYNIHPKQWAMVKAIAGCSTDNVSGVVGVGEKTAIKYLNGDKLSDNKMKDIRRFIKKQVPLNLKLVSLPHENMNPVQNDFKANETNSVKLRKLCKLAKIEEPVFSLKAWDRVFRNHIVTTEKKRYAK
jgi:5'-3' exonuclease